ADQAAAGALLLIPGVVDLVVMSPLFFRWLHDIDEKAKINDLRIQAILEARERAGLEPAASNSTDWRRSLCLHGQNDGGGTRTRDLFHEDINVLPVPSRAACYRCDA